MDKESNKNLLMVLKLFKNRPNHLAKFLIDNGAICSDFLEKIENSEKLSKLSKFDMHFNSISEMNEYYNSLLVDLEDIKEKKTKKELEFEFNLRLKIALQNENYEEASRIRDYMKKNKIKKNF